MNVKETLNVASEELMKIGSLDARLEAEVLLRHVLKIDRATMFRDLDEDVSEIHIGLFGFFKYIYTVFNSFRTFKLLNAEPKTFNLLIEELLYTLL